MPSSKTIDEFRAKYEAQSGHVHVAPDVASVVNVIASILEDSDARRLAVADLPQTLQSAVEELGRAMDIEVLTTSHSGSQIAHLIDSAEVGLHQVAFGIVDTGTLVEIATNDVTRLVSTLPAIHIGIVTASDLVASLGDAARRIQEVFRANPEHCSVTFISGPSRTGDIEMRLTLGVHGPEASHAIVLL